MVSLFNLCIFEEGISSSCTGITVRHESSWTIFMKGFRSLKGEDDDTHTVLHIGEFQLRDDDENSRDFANRILGGNPGTNLPNISGKTVKLHQTSPNFSKRTFASKYGWRVWISSNITSNHGFCKKRPFQIMVYLTRASAFGSRPGHSQWKVLKAK